VSSNKKILLGLIFAAFIAGSVVTLQMNRMSVARSPISKSGLIVELRKIDRYRIDLSIRDVHQDIIVFSYNNLVMPPHPSLKSILKNAFWDDEESFVGMEVHWGTELPDVRLHLLRERGTWQLASSVPGRAGMILRRPADWAGPGGGLRTDPPRAIMPANPLHREEE
jgi:hypothetical protein